MAATEFWAAAVRSAGCAGRPAAGRGGAREAEAGAQQRVRASRRADRDGPLTSCPSPPRPPALSPLLASRAGSGFVPPPGERLLFARGRGASPRAPRMLLLLGVVGAAEGRVAGSGGDSLGSRGLLSLVLLLSALPVWPWLTLKTL